MTPAERRELASLRSEIVALKRRTANIPSRFAGGGDVADPPLYLIVGGNILPAGGATSLASGIARRSDTVSGSELPVGTGGAPGDTVTVPAWPIPANLPLGVGVGRHAFNGAYAFIVNDATGAFPGDLPLNRRAYVGSSVNLDRVSGGITYRYTCLIVVAGL